MYKRPNGTGSIVKLSGNRRNPYQVRVTVGFSTVLVDDQLKCKQDIRVLGSFPTRKTAELFLANYNADPYDPVMMNITFADAYSLALESRQPLAKNTIKSYQNAFKKVERLYKKKLLQIKKVDLQRNVDAQETTATQGQMIDLFRLVFNWAEKDIELIKSNPASNLKITAKPTPKREGKPYTSEEIQLLWDNLQIRYVDTILIQIYTGIRVSEMLAITKDDVHLDERYIEIHGTKTENADRIVPIRKEILPLLEQRVAAADTYLLISPKRKKPLDITYYSHFFDEIRKELNFDHVTHDARHTFVSCADSSGVNQSALKMMVGHSLKGITGKIYTHKDLPELIREVDKIKFL